MRWNGEWTGFLWIHPLLVIGCNSSVVERLSFGGISAPFIVYLFCLITSRNFLSLLPTVIFIVCLSLCVFRLGLVFVIEWNHMVAFGSFARGACIWWNHIVGLGGWVVSFSAVSLAFFASSNVWKYPRCFPWCKALHGRFSLRLVSLLIPLYAWSILYN